MKELFLDTKGACFLCLKETLITSATDKANVGTREVCLRNVCRYLNVNPTQVLFKSLHGEGDEESEDDALPFQRNKCDFSVLLCSTCASITRKLSKLVREMELTKMLMHSKIREFYKMLISSEEKDGNDSSSFGRWKGVRDEISDNPVEARLVEHLREETKKKCSAKIQHIDKTSVPKVRLPVVKPFEDITADLTTKDTEPQVNELDDSAKLPRMGNMFAEKEKLHAAFAFSMPKAIKGSLNSTMITTTVHKNLPSETENSGQGTEIRIRASATKTFRNKNSRGRNKRKTGSSRQKIISNKTKRVNGGGDSNIPNNIQTFVDGICASYSESVLLNNTFTGANAASFTVTGKRCLICNNCFKSDIYHHIVNEHPEKFFSLFKLEHVSEQIFRTKCEKTLKALTDQCDKKREHGRKDSILCLFCNLMFCSIDYLRYHLIFQHYDSVKEKLMSLQQDDDDDAAAHQEENYTELHNIQHSLAISSDFGNTWEAHSQENLDLMGDVTFSDSVEWGHPGQHSSSMVLDEKPLNVICNPSISLVRDVVSEIIVPQTVDVNTIDLKYHGESSFSNF